MGMREQAAADLQQLLSDTENGPASPFTFFDNKNPAAAFPLSGIFGDIGFLISPDTGAAVQGRTIEAVYSMAALKALTNEEPERGWRFKAMDLNGAEFELYVIRYEPDRTVGTGRVKLAVKMV
jgi:hypothetical protein